MITNNQKLMNLFKNISKSDHNKQLNSEVFLSHTHQLMQKLGQEVDPGKLKNRKALLSTVGHFIHHNKNFAEIQKNKKLKPVLNELIKVHGIVKMVDLIEQWEKKSIRQAKLAFEKDIKIFQETYDLRSMSTEDFAKNKDILEFTLNNKIDKIKLTAKTIISFSLYGYDTLQKKDIDLYKGLIGEFYSGREHEIVQEWKDIFNMTHDLIDLNVDVLVNTYLQALDKAVKEKSYDSSNVKLNKFAVSFLAKVDLISCVISLARNIMGIASLLSPVFASVATYILPISIILPLVFTVPRLVKNIGKSIYYRHQHKNWDYFHKVKSQILSDIFFVTISAVLMVPTAGTSAFILPGILKLALDNLPAFLIFGSYALHACWSKYKNNKEANKKISDVNEKIDFLIKKNPAFYEREDEYQELFLLKKTLEEKKSRANKTHNVHIFVYASVAMLSIASFPIIGNVADNSRTINSLFLRSGITPALIFGIMDNIAPEKVADKFDAIVSFFRGKKKNTPEIVKDQLVTE